MSLEDDILELAGKVHVGSYTRVINGKTVRVGSYNRTASQVMEALLGEAVSKGQPLRESEIRYKIQTQTGRPASRMDMAKAHTMAQDAGVKIGKGSAVPRKEALGKPSPEMDEVQLRFAKPLSEVGDLIREGVAEENWVKAAEDTVEVAEGLLAERLLPRFKNHTAVQVLQTHVDRGREAQIRLAVWFHVNEKHKKVLEKLALWAEEAFGGVSGGTVGEHPGSLGTVFTTLGLGNPFTDPVDTVKRVGSMAGSLISLALKAKAYLSAQQDDQEVAAQRVTGRSTR